MLRGLVVWCSIKMFFDIVKECYDEENRKAEGGERGKAVENGKRGKGEGRGRGRSRGRERERDGQREREKEGGRGEQKERERERGKKGR